MSLAIFNQYAHASMLEVIAQQIALFNGASRGALMLKSAKNEGDFSDIALWQRISGLVRRRDAYATGAVTPIDIHNLVNTTVKVAAGTPPVKLPTSMLAWIGRDPKEAGVVVGKQLAEDMLADMVNTGILCAASALNAITAVKYSATGAVLALSGLVSGASKFGDRAEDIKTWLIHSKPMFDLYQGAIANGTSLFSFGTVQVREDGFGRAFVVSDSSSLVVSGTPDNYRTLGLTVGAVTVEQNPDFTSVVVPKTGDENLSQEFQAEWSYNLGVKGFAWDKTNGGASPNNAALGTSTNWDRTATSHKDLAGVLVLTQ